MWEFANNNPFVALLIIFVICVTCESLVVHICQMINDRKK